MDGDGGDKGNDELCVRSDESDEMSQNWPDKRRDNSAVECRILSVQWCIFGFVIKVENVWRDGPPQVAMQY